MTRRERGSGYIDVLAATALFGIALLGSTGLLMQWHRTSARLECRALAQHALAQEMDQVLANPDALVPGTRDWLSKADEATGLDAAAGDVKVEALAGTGLRRVVITLRWTGGRAVRETLL